MTQATYVNQDLVAITRKNRGKTDESKINVDTILSQYISVLLFQYIIYEKNY